MTRTIGDHTQPEEPIACTLSSEDQRRRRDEIASLIAGASPESRRLSDGYALRFPGDEIWASRLLAFIVGERACCPFFTFELIFEPRQGQIWLHLRGPAGTPDFVAGMLSAVKGA
jgi:hypothetical protein